MDYLIVKTLHILSAVLIMGTGLGTAFYLFMVNRTDSILAKTVVSRLVCRADFYFTTPAVIFQPLSGMWLMNKINMPFSATWIWVSIALFLFCGICWLPVVYLQLKMRDIAKVAYDNDTELPNEYNTLAKKWELLGYPAFIAVIVIFFLMVIKPM